ncbi:hypothetical protein MIMGU_mgv1a005407mg [Erythranthe guttata]|uniref:F-box domain-containing protein n=1 Tax=Erythranthe guttata TaxID=4155 RepID=A0A022Q0J7_ERYGU|nr:hypothetical protein MIMGU_mgv1a005407mg [Erythranthe guttata]
MCNSPKLHHPKLEIQNRLQNSNHKTILGFLQFHSEEEMGSSTKIAISWSDLPNELLEKITNCLDTETDVRRLRAVCNSWRSSTTPFKRFPPTPLKLPFPFAAGGAGGAGTSDPKHDGACFTLTERTVYRVQPPGCNEHPDFWLVKIETCENGKVRMLNPLSDHEIKILPENPMPKVLNTLDFRLSEVCKSYALHCTNPSEPNQKIDFKFAKKVAVHASVENGEYAIMAIDDKNKLWYIKSANQNWTIVPGDYNNFLDIVNYKGKFRGIDYWGRSWFFGSMLEVIGSTYFRSLEASKRHFVDVSDELFLIEECNFPRTPIKNTAVQIIISRTDLNDKEWVDGRTTIAKLMGKVIFVGDDCSFSVPAPRVKGPLVFYTDRYIFFRTEEEKKRCGPDEGFDRDYGNEYDDDSDCGYNVFECDCCDSSDDETAAVDSFVPSDDIKIKFRGLHGHNSGVYDFQSGKLGSVLMFPDYANVFWPPPSWLNRG